jgi:hypothetical protein
MIFQSWHILEGSQKKKEGKREKKWLIELEMKGKNVSFLPFFLPNGFSFALGELN